MRDTSITLPSRSIFPTHESHGVAPLTLLSDEQLDDGDNDDGVMLECCSVPTSIKTASVHSIRSAAVANASVASMSVQTLLAANIVGGDYHPEEGYETNYVYDFSVSSNIMPCVLGVSIQKGLQMNATEPTRYQLVQLAQELIKMSQSDMRKQLVRVYEADECVVCQEDAPDTIICSCGHKCIHMQCLGDNALHSCPLCRGSVAALLSA